MKSNMCRLYRIDQAVLKRWRYQMNVTVMKKSMNQCCKTVLAVELTTFKLCYAIEDISLLYLV